MFIDSGSDVHCFDSCLFAIATPLQGLCCWSFKKQHILCSEITGFTNFQRWTCAQHVQSSFLPAPRMFDGTSEDFCSDVFFSVNTKNRHESIKTVFGRFLWPCFISKYLKIGTSFGDQLHPSSFCGFWRFKLPLSCFGQRHDVGSMPSPAAHTQTQKFADGANVQFQRGWLDSRWWSEGVR